MHAARLLERCVRDVKTLLAPGLAESIPAQDDDPTPDRMRLQSDRGEEFESGRNLGEGQIW